MTCADCGSEEAKRATGARIYPHRPDLHHKQFWLCRCGAYCGSHADGRPLGSPAGAETRKARMAAHAAFDRLWKSGRTSRGRAYEWLADAMRLPPEEAHIGMFTRQQAELVPFLVMEFEG